MSDGMKIALLLLFVGLWLIVPALALGLSAFMLDPFPPSAPPM
jgi:hypothetical protein